MNVTFAPLLLSILSTVPSANASGAYATVNGIRMYYETYGKGAPLVLIHGGGSTIQSSFGRVIPALARRYRAIAVELQNHGRSGFRDVPETFEQDADDVAALMAELKIGKASFLGFSNGASTALQIAIRHPAIVEKLVVVAGLYRRDGLVPGFFDGMAKTTLAGMPQGLKDAFLAVNPDTAKLRTMFERDRDRMIAFKDWSDESLRSIAAPTLVVNGDRDVIRPEHALEMARTIPHARLLIVPGTHGSYIGEVETLPQGARSAELVVPMILDFLDGGEEGTR